MKKFLDENGVLYLWQKITSLFVKKETGKGLMSDEEKTKLAELENYELPIASAETLGGVKIGAGLAINNGVVSATGGGTADAVDWANVQNKPTKVSEFTNDAQYQTKSEVDDAISTATEDLGTNESIANAIVEATKDLAKKTDVTTEIATATTDMATKTYVGTQITGATANLATKQELTDAISGVTQFDYQIVETLPETGVKGTIYLIENTGAENNIYDEYLWLADKWELFGTTAIDLAGYLKDTDLVAITNAEIDVIVAQ